MIYVVFVEPETPGNIGFLARTMKNFGLSQLVLINPANWSTNLLSIFACP